MSFRRQYAVMQLLAGGTGGIRPAGDHRRAPPGLQHGLATVLLPLPLVAPGFCSPQPTAAPRRVAPEVRPSNPGNSALPPTPRRLASCAGNLATCGPAVPWVPPPLWRRAAANISPAMLDGRRAREGMRRRGGQGVPTSPGQCRSCSASDVPASSPLARHGIGDIELPRQPRQSCSTRATPMRFRRPRSRGAGTGLPSQRPAGFTQLTALPSRSQHR